MIYFPQLRVNLSKSMAILASATVNSEGTPLIATLTNGLAYASPCGGASGERFVGFSIAQPFGESTMSFVDQAVPNSAYQITLTNTPVAGSVLVLDVTTNTALTSSGTTPPAAGSYYLSGNVVTVNSAQGTDTIKVAYRYNPTVAQLQAIQGMTPPGLSSSYQINMVGVITNGEIWTSEFDTSQNWSEASTVVLGANGLLTTSTANASGTVLRAYITSLPQATSPFLGLSFAAV